MGRVLLLTRVLLHNVGSSKKAMSTATIIGIVILGIFIGIPLIIFTFALSMGGFMLFNQPEQVMALYSTITSSIGVVMIFFSIFTIPGLYYFSKDIPQLLPLPFKSWEIVCAKFLTALVYEYIILGIIFIPMNVAYVVVTGFSFSWLITFLITTITLPIMPVAYGSIAVIILMRFAPFFGNKERFNFIAGMLSIVFAIGLNVFLQTSPIMENPELITDLSQIQLPMVTNVFFVYSNWVAQAVNGGLQYLALYILYVVATMAVFLFLASKLYFKSVLSVTDSQSKKQKLSDSQLKKKTKSSSILFSYTKREILLIVRSSVYLLNLPLSSFMIPIVLLIPLFGGSGTQFGEFVPFIKGLDFSSVMVLNVFIVIGVMTGILVGGMNNISITATVREGSNFFVSKMLPVSYDIQLLAKVIPGIIVGCIAEVMMIAIAVIFFGLPVVASLLLLVTSFMGIVFINMIDLFIGSINPKLDWTTEAEAVKQSILAVVGIFMSIGVMLFFAIFFTLTFLPVVVVFVIMAAILCGASYGFWKLAVKAFTAFAEKY